MDVHRNTLSLLWTECVWRYGDQVSQGSSIIQGPKLLYVAKGTGTEVHWMTSTVSNTDMKLHELYHYSSRVTTSIEEKGRMHEFLQHT